MIEKAYKEIASIIEILMLKRDDPDIRNAITKLMHLVSLISDGGYARESKVLSYNEMAEKLTKAKQYFDLFRESINYTMISDLISEVRDSIRELAALENLNSINN